MSASASAFVVALSTKTLVQRPAVATSRRSLRSEASSCCRLFGWPPRGRIGKVPREHSFVVPCSMTAKGHYRLRVRPRVARSSRAWASGEVIWCFHSSFQRSPQSRTSPSDLARVVCIAEIDVERGLGHMVGVKIVNERLFARRSATERRRRA